MTVEADRQRVAELLGARDLIKECEEMLHGQRETLTDSRDYFQQRLDFWRERYRALDLRRTDRRQGERRLAAERAMPGRRLMADRRRAV